MREEVPFVVREIKAKSYSKMVEFSAHFRPFSERAFLGTVFVDIPWPLWCAFVDEMREMLFFRLAQCLSAERRKRRKTCHCSRDAYGPGS